MACQTVKDVNMPPSGYCRFVCYVAIKKRRGGEAKNVIGAPLVQSGVGIMLQGYDVAKKWADNISAWLDAKGYSSINDIRGIALPNILKTGEVVRTPEGVYAKVYADKFTKCGMHVEVCPADAATMVTPQDHF